MSHAKKSLPDLVWKAIGSLQDMPPVTELTIWEATSVPAALSTEAAPLLALVRLGLACSHSMIILPAATGPKPLKNLMPKRAQNQSPHCAHLARQASSY